MLQNSLTPVLELAGHGGVLPTVLPGVAGEDNVTSGAVVHLVLWAALLLTVAGEEVGGDEDLADGELDNQTV